MSTAQFTTKEDSMPSYLVSVMHGDDLDLPAGVRMEDVFHDVDAFNTQLRQDGNWVFGAGLMPASSATVVRNVVPGAEPVITDGPYLETKEYMGGFWVLKAADLDEALKLAEQASAARPPRQPPPPVAGGGAGPPRRRGAPPRTRSTRSTRWTRSTRSSGPSTAAPSPR